MRKREASWITCPIYAALQKTVSFFFTSDRKITKNYFRNFLEHALIYIIHNTDANVNVNDKLHDKASAND